MLNIYPEKRSKALPLISHPWISYPSRNKEHISQSQEENIRDLEKHHEYLKSTCVFYRDLKTFSEVTYDADCGEDFQDDELFDPDCGFRTLQ